MSMIRSDKFFKQGILYENMEHGKMHPSDIDAMVEMNGNAYYFVELKRSGSDLRTGQKIMLERLCNDLNNSGKAAYALLAHHDWDCEDERRDIYLAKCKVDMVYYPSRKEWLEPNSAISVKDFDSWFFEKYGEEKEHDD